MSTSTRYRQFVAVVEHGSYRRAATALRISQPALSKSVQALEAELGVQLLDRQSRSMALTVFGQRVLDHARQMSGAEEDLRHDLSHLASLASGHVEVMLGPYPSLISGYPAAARLLRQHPQLSLALHVAGWRTVVQAVLARQIDLGLAELSEAADHPALNTEVVGRHRAHFLCRTGHPILRRRQAAMSDLLRYPGPPPAFRRASRAFPANLGRAGHRDDATGDFVPAVEMDLPMQLGAFANDTDTLVISTLVPMEHELSSGRLALVRTPAAFAADYGFVWLRQRSLSPAAQAYAQAVRDAEQAYAAREAQLCAQLAAPI